MSEEPSKIKWGVERRLEFIEFRLLWEDGIRRSDIMNMFSVSEAQASKDLTLYQEMAPTNATYDKNSKRYVAAEGCQPVFLKGGSADYLRRLRSLGEGLLESGESWIGSPPDIDVVVSPTREVNAYCLHTVMQAIRENRSLEIFYQSMGKERPAPVWRRVTPHGMGYDGFRWHVRAFCHQSGLYKDFLISRIFETRDFGESGQTGELDRFWNEKFEIVIAPHPNLSLQQQAMVIKDYSMEADGTKNIEVRYAMLYYVLKRLGLNDDPENKDARTQHIVLRNIAETKEALSAADWSV